MGSEMCIRDRPSFPVSEMTRVATPAANSPVCTATAAPATVGSDEARVGADEEDDDDVVAFCSPSSTAPGGVGLLVDSGASSEGSDSAASGDEGALPVRARIDDTCGGCVVKFCTSDLGWFCYWLCAQLPAHVGSAVWRSESELIDLGAGVELRPAAERERLRRRYGWWRLLGVACRVEWAQPPALGLSLIHI